MKETDLVPSTTAGIPVRVLIADRSSHYRETLRRVLAHYHSWMIVGESETLTEAVAAARGSDPDVVLLDVGLVMNLDAAALRGLAAAFPDLQVIVMLDEDSVDYRSAIAERWGYSCIAKERAEEDLAMLLAAVRPALA
jgi:DNA-binding NarL/FixJ family response regulator